MSAVQPMTKIGAWIRDPANNIFKGMSKRAGLYELFCEKPEACDLLQKENTCLNCSVGGCKFGRKVETEGPTRQSRSFYKTLEAWRERNAGFMDKLSSLKAWKRVFKTNGHFYLPYSFMTGSIAEGTPLASKWVAEEQLTTALLTHICTAKPRALFGGVIPDYQEKEVPKFISDLAAHDPEIFDRLPDDQKARLKTVSYVGRQADITTCAPGKYVFGQQTWAWDGEVLRGGSMLFQPVKGDLTITIKPEPGQSVTITQNEQVTHATRFID